MNGVPSLILITRPASRAGAQARFPGVQARFRGAAWLWFARVV
jgi:hypothetical protein